MFTGCEGRKLIVRKYDYLEIREHHLVYNSNDAIERDNQLRQRDRQRDKIDGYTYRERDY